MLKNRSTLIVRVPSSNLSLTQRRLWTLDFNILSVKHCVLPGIWCRLFNPKSKEKESSQSHFFFSLSARLWNPWIKWEQCPHYDILIFPKHARWRFIFISCSSYLSPGRTLLGTVYIWREVVRQRHHLSSRTDSDYLPTGATLRKHERACPLLHFLTKLD